ncbi:WD40 repeat domain-containing protein [Actinomadura rupiterrae]|uniref:WD40 repeat domain-containing protein n=1 Tax=Actinomadura rupiterrae TaxID=559627 RepID=UPI0020A6124A|nr:hypothetical protein [Actinomadura rupiterrae]MCP2336434.1 WD40 repeat protein [Actinomadura rupiterrae]
MPSAKVPSHALLTDCVFLVHADPAQVVPLLEHAEDDAARLAAAVYRTSLHAHRHATPSVRRQLLALDAARWGSPDLSARFADIPITDAPKPLWKVTESTGSGARPRFLFQLEGAEHGRAVTIIELNGRAVAVHGGASGIRMWDMATGTVLVPPGTALADVRNVVAFARAGGRSLALAAEQERCGGWLEAAETARFQVWDLTSGEPVGDPVTGPAGYLATVAFTVCADRPIIAAYIHGRGVTVWDEAGGTPLCDSDVDIAMVACAIVNGRPVVATGVPDTVTVWSRASGAWTGQMTVEPPGWLSAIEIGELGGRPVLMTGSGVDAETSNDHQIRMWDLADGEPVGQPLSSGHTDSIGGLNCVSASGRTLAVTAGSAPDWTVRAWNLTDGFQLGGALTGHQGSVMEAAIAEVDKVTFAVTVDMRDQVFLWNLSPQAIPQGSSRTAEPSGADTLATTELDGRSVALIGSWEAGLQLRDLATSDPLGPSFAAEELLTIRDVAATVLDGRPILLVAGESDAAVRRWDVLTGEPLAPLKAGADASKPWPHDSETMLAVACTEMDGRPVALAGGEHAELWMWDLASGEPLGTMHGHLKWSEEAQGRPGLGTKLYITALTCTHLDGRPIAVTGGEDGTVRRWDLTTLQQIGTPEIPAQLDDKSKTITSLCHTELDGRPVVISGGQDRTLRTWDLATGEGQGPAMTFPAPITKVSATEAGLEVRFGADTAVLEAESGRGRNIGAIGAD